MTARFLIAKYAPDIRRMEPRNIGVIVWCNGQTDSLFLGEDAEARIFTSIPRRLGVRDTINYQRWVSSWRRQLSKATLELRHGHFVTRSSPDFIDGLREWSRANYMLVDGGEAEPVLNGQQLHKLTVQLFRELVVSDGDEVRQENEHKQLKSRATELWKSLGVWDRGDFRRDLPSSYQMFGERKVFTFDYAIGPSESPYSVSQRVILGHQKTFDSVFMNLEHYQRSRKLEKNRIAAIVLPSESPDVKQRDTNLRLLGHITTVIDLTKPEAAKRVAQEVASKNGRV